MRPRKLQNRTVEELENMKQRTFSGRRAIAAPAMIRHCDSNAGSVRTIWAHELFASLLTVVAVYKAFSLINTSAIVAFGVLVTTSKNFLVHRSVTVTSVFADRFMKIPFANKTRC